MGFQPGSFRISATGTVHNTPYHRHNLYLGTDSDWTICKRMYMVSMPVGAWSPLYVGSCPLWAQSVAR